VEKLVAKCNLFMVGRSMALEFSGRIGWKPLSANSLGSMKECENAKVLDGVGLSKELWIFDKGLKLRGRAVIVGDKVQHSLMDAPKWMDA